MFSCDACYVTQAKAEGKQIEDTKNTPGIKRVATKKFLIARPPEVLTLHLKRFEQDDYRLRKVNKHVQFEDMLDLAPFCADK